MARTKEELLALLNDLGINYEEGSSRPGVHLESSGFISYGDVNLPSHYFKELQIYAPMLHITDKVRKNVASSRIHTSQKIKLSPLIMSDWNYDNFSNWKGGTAA